jgi:hypothetical protein
VKRDKNEITNLIKKDENEQKKVKGDKSKMASKIVTRKGGSK